MTLPASTKVYAVQDAAVAQLLTDVTTAPTYGSLYDVPGIKKVGMDFDMKNVELRGDNKRMESGTIVLGVKVTFDHAKLSTDVVKTILGSTVTASGTTPSQVTKVTGKGSDVVPYFFFGAKTPTGGADTATGDVQLQLPKLKVTKYTLGFAEEDFFIFSGEASGVFTVTTDTLWQLLLNETAAAITTAL